MERLRSILLPTQIEHLVAMQNDYQFPTNPQMGDPSFGRK